jgi:hypothetical protein
MKRITIRWLSLVIVASVLTVTMASGVLPNNVFAETFTSIRNLLVEVQLIVTGPSTFEYTVSVAVPTAVPTATPGLLINSLAVGNLIEAQKAGTPVFYVSGDGSITYSGSMGVQAPLYLNAGTAVATATPALLVNSAAVGNLVEFRDGGSSVFAINNGGAIVAAGPQTLSNYLAVSAPTAQATAIPALSVDSLGVSVLFEVRDAATPVLAVNNGGTVDMLGNLADSGGNLTVADSLDVTAGLDVQGGNITLQNDETISNSSNGVIDLTATTINAVGNLASTDGLDVAGGWPAVAGSADVVDITETAAILDGSDTIEGIDINLTGANNTGTGNDLTGINLSLATADPQGRERAIVADDVDWEAAMDAGPIPIISTSQEWMEDGFGDTIHPEIVLLNGSSNAADPALAQDQFGVITLSGGDSNASVAADTSEMALGLHWSAAQGGLVFETRLHSDTDVSTARICAGLTDTLALEQPATIGGSDVVTGVADDFVVFCYDTGADTDMWFAISADSTVAGTGGGSTGIAPTHSVYQVLRIEVDASGAQARFYIDGALVKTITAGAITPATLLTPFVTCQSLAADLQVVDVDYVYVNSKR